MSSAVNRQLARRYEDAIHRNGRNTESVETAPSERINDLRSGRIYLAYGCVGELLDQLDAKKGQQLRALYKKEKSPDRDKWRDITHSTMLAALPADLGASDPGMASVCDDDTLPQNIVAIYLKPHIDRDDRRELNNLAGGVSASQLDFTPRGASGESGSSQ